MAATWALSRMAPRSQREALLGDLAEEYALRAKVHSPAAFHWFLRQAGASVLPLLWLRVTQGKWLAITGIALLAYVAVGVVEFLVNWLITNSSTTGAVAYRPLGMLATFPFVVLIGYCAARYRREAALLLVAMMLLAVTLMTLTSTEIVPTWYQITYFLVGPSAVFIGSNLHSFRPRRS